MLGLAVSSDELHGLLVERLELLSGADFEQARRVATRFRVPLERALLDRTGMSQRFLLTQIADEWHVDFVDLKVTDVDHHALDAIPEEFARSHALVAFARSGGELRVAMRDPRDTQVIEHMARMTGLKVEPCLASEIAIRRAHLVYRGDLRGLIEHPLGLTGALAPSAEGGVPDERSAVALLSHILEFAAAALASDIHIEPFERETIVRCRIDGMLQDVLSLPPVVHPALVVRVKMLAQLRIDERRVPQDGQFKSDLGGFDLEFRVSTLPTVWGEKIVLRVHSKEIVLQDLEDLGLAHRDHEIVLRNIRRPHGMILLTGPTASGKSTSLYAMLMRIGAERQNVVNISTVEDPVEYRLPRVNQVQINPQAGVEFSTTLRALLRQDPDIVMVGEIRDLETAELAVRAALVGRLFLSTLHTNDAPGAVPRLLDIGIEPFLLASTLCLVVAQRLVRRICPACRESVTVDPSVVRGLRARPDFARTVEVLRAEGVLGAEPDPFSSLRLYRGKGCPQCEGTGYRRRLAVFELLEVSDEIRGLIRERADSAVIRDAAVRSGMKTLFQDGLAKVFLGETTLEEVLRVAL